MPIWLTREDVRIVLSMPDAIDAVEKAFILASTGQSELPLRTNMAISRYQGSLLSMPAYVGGDVDALGVKLITLYAENPTTRNLPAIQGNFVLFDPVDGQLLAIMEAGYMTAVRTGAASGVATRHLARADAKVVTIFGTGAQAPCQLEAVCVERDIERGWVLSRTWSHAQQFSEEMSQRLGLALTATKDTKRAVSEADIVITATSAGEPLFDGDWLRSGVHVNGVGSHTPDTREVDTLTIRRARVVTDQTSACLSEAGDLIIPLDAGDFTEADIYAEIGEIAAGRKAGRSDPDDITFFKSVGLAAQDVAVASLVYRQAQARGVGQRLGV